jgi:cell division protein FtsB
MDRFKILERLPHFARNKFFLTSVFFIVWLMLFDSNNLISRYREQRHLYSLKREKEFYIEKITADGKKLHELQTGNDNLEKFAREQYKMKKPDEDLYIVMTPAESRRNKRRNN